MRGVFQPLAHLPTATFAHFAPSPPFAPSRSRRQPYRWLALLIGALLIGGGAWWLYPRQQLAPSPAAAEAVPPEEQALREVARRSPKDPGAQRAVGEYLLGQRRPYEAMWAFQDAQELQPEDADARRGLARALIMAGLPRRALAVLADRPPPAPDPNPKSKIQNPKSDVEDRRVAMAAYLSMGDALGAVTMLEAVGAGLESSAPALLDLGNAYEVLGDDQAAGRAYQRHLRLQPSSLEGHLALARVAARERLWREAFAALTRARQIAPADPRPLYHYGLALLAQEAEEGQGVQASSGRPAEPLAQSKIQNPKSKIAPPRSAEVFQQVLAAHPDYGPAHLRMGLWRLRQGHAAAAVESLERAVVVRAGGEETRLRLAEALEAAGQKAAAAYHRGLYFEATQQPHRAVREYQRLAALDPGRKDVPLLLSAVYSQIEENGKAAEVARQGLERHPEDPRLLARRAQLLLMIGNRAEGAKLCRRWIERDPQAAEPYRLLERVELEAGRPAESVRLLEQAIARAPDNAEYYREMGRALTAQPTPANLRRAAEMLRRAVALDPRDAETHLRLGEALERLGDREGALQQYQRSMDRDRSVRYGAYSLAQLCPRLGKGSRARFYADIVRVLREREDAAKALWRQVYETPDAADAHSRLAELLLEAGDTRQARHQLEQVVRLRPDDKKPQRQLQILERLHSLRQG